MDSTRLKNLAGIMLSEAANDYEDSAEFTADLEEVGSMINKIHKIVHSKKWINWCKITDENFDTQTINKNAGLTRQIDGMKKVFEMFEDEMRSAE